MPGTQPLRTLRKPQCFRRCPPLHRPAERGTKVVVLTVAPYLVDHVEVATVATGIQPRSAPHPIAVEPAVIWVGKVLVEPLWPIAAHLYYAEAAIDLV